jgi:beta-lactamase regulating signal transducer with metallopeptidase domain
MSALLIAVVLKGSILMTAAAAAVVLLSRASAAMRHFVWTLAIAGLLLLPMFALVLPSWEIAVPIASSEMTEPIDVSQAVTAAQSIPVAVTNGTAIPIERESGSVAARLPWGLLSALVYALGVFALLLRLLVHHTRARRLTREAAIVSDPEWKALLEDCAMRIGVQRPVTLLRSRVQVIPITTGTVAPAIVIPADSDMWDEERRAAVLLHELAHIARHDCLTQMLCAIASAVYWVHPGMWYVARRLRVERELACDDRVLAAGAHAGNYAGHLLELAYGWSGRRAPALVVGMAGSNKLEGRMRAVLDSTRNRTAPTRRAWLAGATVAAALLLPIAAVSMTSADRVRDGARDRAGDRARDGARDRARDGARDGARDRAGDQVEALAQAPGGSDRIAGTWEIRPGRTSERVRVRIDAGSFSANGELDARELDRYVPQSVLGANGPIRFDVSREAGTLAIEGTLKSGAGSGTFTFTPSQTFIAGLTARGFARPTTQQLFALAQNDIGIAFIDELAAQKYAQPEMSDLVRAAHHGVGIDFVREMGQAGYRIGTLEALIRFRDHGVDPEFIRELRAQGVSDLSPDDLVRARDHGVDAEYVGGLKSHGYASLPFETLVRARDHGVDPEYLRGMRQLGFTPELEDVIRARDHGIDPEFVGEMRRLGYTMTLPDLIRGRDHGVTPDYIEMMAAVGYKALPIETLIRLRDHGVTPDYVVELRKGGHDNLSADEIIRLRDRGVASSDYRLDRLVAYLSETKLARAIEKIILKSQKAVDKSQKAIDKTEKAVDKLTR